MKVFALLRKEKNIRQRPIGLWPKKRRDYSRREQDILSRHGKEQFKKLLDWGLPISVSV